MMESNFYSDEFEQLIRGKTEQYKMYPSEKTWKGVYSALHTKKRWFFAGMSLLVTGIILVAGKELILPSAHTGSVKKQSLVATLTPPKSTAENIQLPAAFSEFRGGSHSAEIHNPQGSGPLQDLPPAPNEIAVADPGMSQTSDPAGSASPHMDPSRALAITARAPAPATNQAIVENNHAAGYLGYLTKVRTGSGLIIPDPSETHGFSIVLGPAQGNIQTTGFQIPLHPGTVARTNARRIHLAEQAAAETLSAADSVGNEVRRVNWLQEYAVYNIHSNTRKNTAYWELYFAPTINTRSLSGGAYASPKSAGIASMTLPSGSLANPNASLLQNIGLEGGGSLLFKVNRILSVKAGLQFNYSRFAINAYTVSSAPAAVAAGASPGSAPSGSGAVYNNPPDPVSAASSAGILSRSNQGSSLFNNEYYQLSAPVGIELRVWGNDRLQVNIATTLQPTYQINTDAYLLTTDYSNYSRQPALFRRWNLNGGAEAYVSYKIGNLRLVAGPEFRYQFLSSYSGQSPIRENLASYGLKIGIIKAIR